MKPKVIDVLEIEKLIRVSIPDSMVRYCSNYDDFYHGWDICPFPGTLIRFNIELDNPLQIKLMKYTTVTYSETCQVKQMYFGIIPPSDQYEPDLGFIKQLLKNWEHIG